MEDNYTLEHMLSLLPRADCLLFSPNAHFIGVIYQCTPMHDQLNGRLLQRLVLDISRGVDLKLYSSVQELVEVFVPPVKELCLIDGLPGQCINWNPIIDGDKSNLRKLEVYARIDVLVLLYSYLTRAPNLETVELQKYINDSTIHRLHPDWYMQHELPKLATLKANYLHQNGYDPYAVVQSPLPDLTLPALKHLELGCRVETSDLTMTWPKEHDMNFFARSQCSLHTLALPHIIISPLFSSLIACQPAIQVLEVDMCEQDLEQDDHERPVAELMDILRDPMQLTELERLVVRVRPEHIDALAEVLTMRHTKLQECDVLIDSTLGEYDLTSLEPHRGWITLQWRSYSAGDVE